MRIEKENPKNPKSEITEPMLFPRNALASRPQACFFAEKAIAKVKVAKPSLLAPIAEKIPGAAGGPKEMNKLRVGRLEFFMDSLPVL